ncbi:MAG: M14 family zinc carboxypeptidase [Xanthomonadales bacterium]|nr:M14 family zinc carboxypeptidase [Xanthomonadales bacterium]
MRLNVFLLGIALCATALAKPSAEYLPATADLDATIPSPESVFGWEPGDWRVDHAKLVRYMYQLAEKSDRVSIKVTGRTYEQRPLLQLVIASKENQQRIEELREAHLRATQNDDPDAPLVVWLGYSVHGDEASGSNAAPIVAWYLAASRSGFVDELLDNTIIILDPSLNPDGMNRFASWSNSNHSMTAVADRNGRIHHQEWPSGRTNHYLFDLNRDWLPLVHPESRARITEYHRWLPHVITDHHETRTDGYFFQPGVPTRQHPLTTPGNLAMTRALAVYHAEAMDQAGELYFTEDMYDDFYYGKGSSYPDINGSIGILFEQPRVQGQVYDRDAGPLTFQQAIQNHVRTSLSTLKGAYELRDELKTYQAGFYRQMQQRAEQAGFAAWVIGDNGDPARARELLGVFSYHQVDFQALDAEISVDGKTFRPGHAWVIPVGQRQFGVIQAMLETRTEFEDNTFYDVSAWNLAMAYDLPVAELKRIPATRNAAPVPDATGPVDDAVAWIVPWQQLQAPRLLQRLLSAGIRVRAATKPFTMQDNDRQFGGGSLVILAGMQDEGQAGVAFSLLKEASGQGINVYSFDTLMTASGPGLGTRHFKPVPAVKPLLITGRDTRMYDAGEAWFTLDTRLAVPPVMVDMDRLSSIDLSAYTHLLLVDGQYNGIGKDLQNRITTWINNGGVLVAIQHAASWAESLCFAKLDCEKPKDEDGAEKIAPMAYADFDDLSAQRTIAGAIVHASVDNTHPVAFGHGEEIHLFRKGTTLLKPSENPFATPLRYGKQPLVSGYISAQRLAEMDGQPAVIAERHGKGLVVRFANNPLFRGFWRGTERFWVNALFFGPLVNQTELPK